MPEYTQSPGVSKEELGKLLQSASVAILLVGDIHFSDRAPSSANDSYNEDLLEMLRWIAVEIDQQYNIAATIFAGDIFNHKQPARNSHALVMKAIQAFQRFDNPYIVVGNHDVTNDRMDSLEKQPLGVIFESGAAQELDGWLVTETDNLPVYGVPWQQRWTNEDTPSEALASFRRGSQKIRSHSLVVTHAPIYPPGQELEFEFVPTEGEHGISAAMGNTGHLYYGHIHEPHGIFDVDGVTYANMGALSRGSLHEYNKTRAIQVAIWTPEYGFIAVDVPHKPAEEVFKLEEAASKQESKVDLDKFLSEVGNNTLEISSTESVIAHIRALEVEKTVKAKAIEILEQVS